MIITWFVILSMPAHSATGLVMRSEDAGAGAGAGAAAQAVVAATRTVAAAISAFEVWPKELMQKYRWLRPGDSSMPKANRGCAVSKQLNANCGDKGPKRRPEYGLRPRGPGVVVASHLRAMLVGQDGALGTIGAGRSGQVRPMRLLPLASLVALARWRCIDAVMDPTMPAWRNLRGFGIVAIDDPAAGTAFRIDAALVVDVAGLVLADLLAEAPSMKTGAECLAVPLGKELQQESFHPDPRGGSGSCLSPAYGVTPPRRQGFCHVCGANAACVLFSMRALIPEPLQTSVRHALNRCSRDAGDCAACQALPVFLKLGRPCSGMP